VFGMSAGEMMIVLIIGIVVVGPKRLPDMMRKLGTYVAKLRRLSSDLRSQSGIDRILKEEGLEKEIRELRALRESLSKHALFDSLVNAANSPVTSPASKPRAISGGPKTALPAAVTHPTTPAEPKAADEPEIEGPMQPVDRTSSAKVAQSSDGTETTSSAAGLIQPAVATIPRGGATAPTAPANRTPYKSFREREYPSYGPDHYGAFPDDIDDSDLGEAAQAAAEPSSPEAAPPAEGSAL
jgi:sec-independent protein translocase protein TatB